MATQKRLGFCRHTRHYRIWIYSFNLIIMILSIAFVFVARRVLDDEKLVYLFSIRLGADSDFALLYIYVGPALQFLVCFMGILATIGDRPQALKAYWCLTAILIVCDAGVGLAWVPRFKEFHRLMPDRLKLLLEAPPDQRFCSLWNDVQTNFHCCGVDSYKDWLRLTSFCQEPFFDDNRLPHSCCSYENRFCNTTALLYADTVQEKSSEDDQDGCIEPLLKWLHARADVLFMFGYCTLFLMKIISSIILKREIRELLSEIYHERQNPPHRRFSDFIGVPNIGPDDDDEVIDLKKEPSRIIGKRTGVEV